MAKRVITKIGDVFSIPISETEKRYMQLIAFDSTQLNSDVVRIFEKKYSIEENLNIEFIINDNTCVYVHCTADLGIKLNLWEKVGRIDDVGDLKNIIFRDTNDYGKKIGSEPVKISNNWFVWRINEDFKDVGKLEGETKNSFIGLVINPLGILEIAKGNKYPVNYPDFE